VRSQPSLSGVPVLLLAGAFEPVDQAQAARLGADGVLTKPFDPASLVGRVSELFARPRGAASSKMEAAAPAAASAPAARPASPAPAASPDRDRYFEEIDQAFAALSRAPRAPLTPLAPADDAVLDETEPDAPADTAARPSPAPAPLEPSTLPLTDAFAALLDAERTGTPVDTLWRPAPAAAGDRVDVERLADLVARRVLEQLSDRVVRESVAAIVSATAERLVREEIERIKRHIK
jgi:CheY-like chemotaxis protein